MLLLGIDVGTSSIKVSVVDSDTLKCLGSTQYPEVETGIKSLRQGWAEQDPELWWENIQQAILKLNKSGKYKPHDIAAIGIAYQMHGLVVVDKNQSVLRDSIIWCDSRAVLTGDNAFRKIGKERCLTHLLNSPGNFTAAKLGWVKENESEIFDKIVKVMLPGDFISMKLTGEITTTPSALSEGVFWDFKENSLSADILEYFGFDENLLPITNPVFSSHGGLKREIAEHLSLKTGIPVTYKSGDQPNNALSLNVLNPGEVAANAGTSGVIYGVTDKLTSDPQSRVNTFAHVNYSTGQKRLGVLLCINGTGILNSWVKNNFSSASSYQMMNEEAGRVKVGSDGIRILPFGNGAERILNNKIIGAQFLNIDFNIHTKSHLFRAVQEGIAFSFRYGLDIMRENGMNPKVIRAGKANLFLSDLFTDAFVNSTQVPVELYNNDGSVGAAIGAGIGIGVFNSPEDAFKNIKADKYVEPGKDSEYEEVYQDWKNLLMKFLNN